MHHLGWVVEVEADMENIVLHHHMDCLFKNKRVCRARLANAHKSSLACRVLGMAGASWPGHYSHIITCVHANMVWQVPVGLATIHTSSLACMVIGMAGAGWPGHYSHITCMHANWYGRCRLTYLSTHTVYQYKNFKIFILGGYGHTGKRIQKIIIFKDFVVVLNWAKRLRNCRTSSWCMPSPNAHWLA